MTDKHHEIAECPRCGKHDLIEKDNHQWVCLNCEFTKDLSALSVIADCPFCGKRDFVEKKHGKWECLSCGRSRNVADLGKDVENFGLFPFIVTIFLTLLALSALTI